MNAMVQQPSMAQMIETVMVKGDLSKLTVEERNSYYLKVCESAGLNPLTKPFEYITLNGKLRLYALKDCTDQLRFIHKVSVEEMLESERDGVFIVTAKVRDKDGRSDIAKGAVFISGLKGESLANAMMKAETKAKRRATLSICGLGLLDETEIEDIPAAAKGEAVPALPKKDAGPLYKALETEIRACVSESNLKAWASDPENKKRRLELPVDWRQNIDVEYGDKLATFQ